MMMMNCFYGMADRRKAFSRISSQEHCQRFSPSQISETPRAESQTFLNEVAQQMPWMSSYTLDTYGCLLIYVFYKQSHFTRCLLSISFFFSFFFAGLHGLNDLILEERSSKTIVFRLYYWCDQNARLILFSSWKNRKISFAVCL